MSQGTDKPQETVGDALARAVEAQRGPASVWTGAMRELAAVQAEFSLPGPLVDGMATAAKRPVLEVVGELLVAVVKTASRVAAEETVRLGEVQLVLGDGFVVSVDGDAGVLDRVPQDSRPTPSCGGASAIRWCWP